MTLLEHSTHYQLAIAEEISAAGKQFLWSILLYYFTMVSLVFVQYKRLCEKVAETHLTFNPRLITKINQLQLSSSLHVYYLVQQQNGIGMPCKRMGMERECNTIIFIYRVKFIQIDPLQLSHTMENVIPVLHVISYKLRDDNYTKEIISQNNFLMMLIPSQHTISVV